MSYARTFHATSGKPGRGLPAEPLALSTTYAYGRLANVPASASKLWVQFKLTSMATSPSRCTWFLASDAEAHHPITDEVISDIINQGQSTEATKTSGGFAVTLDVPWSEEEALDGGLPGGLTVAAKLDVGTADLVVVLRGER